MVTFLADRFPILNEAIFGVQYRAMIAIALSLLVGWLVNRGPKMAARAFGPATAGVLMLLWAMVIASIAKYGIQLPQFSFEAFKPEVLKYTIGGYVRILAVMTGIEVFANLVTAYEGKPAERSKKAFNSMMMVMGTTAITMLIVGPTIFNLADPNHPEISVFTQTMDILLPAPLPMIGTLVSTLVLMSASAASAQGLQNLALGLKERRYIPPVLGEQNQFGVADKPVWIEVGIVVFCFLFFSTNEETYLAIYAAGVFIHLAIVGWSVVKRLIRQAKEKFNLNTGILIIGAIAASVMTSFATVVIFEERFFEGAWTFFIFIPLLYAFFSYSRSILGAPSAAMDYLGRFNASQLAGFGLGQASSVTASNGDAQEIGVEWQPEPIERSQWRDKRVEINKVAVLLDGSIYAATALPYAKAICNVNKAKLYLVSGIKREDYVSDQEFEKGKQRRKDYLRKVSVGLKHDGVDVEYSVNKGGISHVAREQVEEHEIDMVVTSTRGKSGSPHWKMGGVSNKLMRAIEKPVLLVNADIERDVPEPTMSRILVSLDGSIRAEAVLVYARALAQAFDSELILLAVPEVPEAEQYRAPWSAVRLIRNKMVDTMQNFLEAVSRTLNQEGVKTRFQVKGSMPVRTIISTGNSENVDLILMTSRGRGGVDRLFIGSVAEDVVEQSNRSVLMVPVLK
jgi:nucleotide-binding universal stress UspA family protein